jgi:hypothetical protein
MSYSSNDDPTIPPPGRRTGKGAESVVPYLKKSLASKPKPHTCDRDDTRPPTKAAVPVDDRGEDSILDFVL